MWPWEHLAVGYLLASAYHLLGTDERPTAATVTVVAIGTQLPDLIDKPLAWTFDVLPSGLSLAHSLAFSAALSVAALSVARRRECDTLGVVFVLAYLSHLAGDVAFSLLVGEALSVGFLLWPFVPASPDPGVGLLARVGRLAGGFGTFLGTPRGRLYLFFEACLFGSAAVAWLVDGRPGAARFGRR